MQNEIKKGSFREDLFYRLNVFPLTTLDLGERPDDILPISAALLRRHTDENESIPLLTDGAISMLKNHDWPGNVRELENVLQRAMVICNENIVTTNDIMNDNSLNSAEKSLANRLQSSEILAATA